STDTDHLSNCAFVDKSGFDINLHSSSAWSIIGTPTIVNRPSNSPYNTRCYQYNGRSRH
ncbi:hypothetical protein EDC96DRAFT_435998, partial [Choanephora cucurbitarum]